MEKKRQRSSFSAVTFTSAQGSCRRQRTMPFPMTTTKKTQQKKCREGRRGKKNKCREQGLVQISA
jgi:hypothetical protein